MSTLITNAGKSKIILNPPIIGALFQASFNSVLELPEANAFLTSI